MRMFWLSNVWAERCAALEKSNEEAGFTSVKAKPETIWGIRSICEVEAVRPLGGGGPSSLKSTSELCSRETVKGAPEKGVMVTLFTRAASTLITLVSTQSDRLPCGVKTERAR